MLRLAKDIERMTLAATDGSVGTVRDLYFDDERWTVRYLVIQMGRWSPEGSVLITPMSLSKPDWSSDVLPVTLTREQIRQAPSIDTQEPVSRQQETGYLQQFGYPLYWDGPGVWGEYPDPYTPARNPVDRDSTGHSTDREDGQEASRIGSEDVHLRSMREVRGYHLYALDGQVGHADDFLIDSSSWSIRYVLVDTSNWIGGDMVLVPPGWTRAVEWTSRRILVGVLRTAIRDSPRFDPSKIGDADYENDLRQQLVGTTMDVERR